MEYKGVLDITDIDHKRKLLKTVCAFANTDGGLLIYGVKEDGGIPIEINGIAVTDKDEMGQWIEQYVRSNSEPQLPSLEIEFIDKNDTTENVFIIVKVQRSWNMPHWVNMGPNTKKFYIRRGRYSEEMDYFELKNTFNLSETLIEKINNFRNERISSILSDSRSPLPLFKGSKVVLHLIPLNSFYTGKKYDINQVLNYENFIKLRPIYGVSINPRINFEGFATYTRLDEDRTGSFTQLYRNGIIEAVSTELLNNDEKKISRGFHEIKIVESIENYLKIYEEMRVELPILIFITLIGVKNYTMYIPKSRASLEETFPIDRDILTLPEVILENLEEDVGNILKSCFDSVWNACGYKGSENYNSEGEWNPR